MIKPIGVRPTGFFYSVTEGRPCSRDAFGITLQGEVLQGCAMKCNAEGISTSWARPKSLQQVFGSVTGRITVPGGCSQACGKTARSQSVLGIYVPISLDPVIGYERVIGITNDHQPVAARGERDRRSQGHGGPLGRITGTFDRGRDQGGGHPIDRIGPINSADDTGSPVQGISLQRRDLRVIVILDDHP